MLEYARITSGKAFSVCISVVTRASVCLGGSYCQLHLPVLCRYVYEPAYDSYGQIWTYAAHRYVGCLVIMAVFTAAMLGVKGSYTAALIMLFTLVPYLIVFNHYLTQRFDAVVAQLPVITTVGAEEICIDPTTYAPPPLLEHGKGWHLDWGKAWQYWGVPRYGL